MIAIMFDRFTDEAKRAIFFARVNTSRRRGDDISIEDLREGIQAAARCGQDDEAAEELLGQWERRAWFSDTAREIPFAPASRAALEYAATDAEADGAASISPDHLQRGILHVTTPPPDSSSTA